MVLKELYDKGMDFQSFANQDGDSNKEIVLEIYNNIVLDNKIIELIKGIDKKIYILGFAEIWCPDCKINVPPVGKLIEINHNIDFRLVPREGNEKAMEPYKYKGKIRIPTFVIMDHSFNEIGVFIETPSKFKKIITRGNELECIIAKRKYKKAGFVNDTIEEVLSIIINGTQ